jgi:tetratricopeptide (TPR) repeat protein
MPMMREAVHADTSVGKALALSQKGHIAAAGSLLEEVLTAHPGHVPALSLLGTIALQSRDLSRAAQLFDRAAACEPNDAAVQFNLGWALQLLREWEEALACYERAILLDGSYAEAYSNRGVVLGQLGRLDEALASFEQSLRLQPDSAPAHFNLGYALLLKGDFQNGWQHHEWRRKLAGEPRDAEAKRMPLWLGRETLAGKSILLRSEQGMGDTLQFCRYVKPVANLGARVILEAPGLLVSLLADLEGVTQIVTQGGPLPACDYYCPLLSLPLAFSTTVDTIPSGAGYLFSDAGKLAEWRERLGERAGPRVGLAWSGNTANPNDAARSIPLRDLLANLPGEFSYVSVQKEVRSSDAALFEESGIASYADELNDFSDTAALCDCLDLVIAVDTSVVHLNGALGNETWVLLPFSASWRWLLERCDSPWYPQMLLYRQERAGSWTDVLRRVAADLRHRFSGSAA